MPEVNTATASTLARLGYPPEMRLVILHADDLGMCLAENEATLAHATAGFGRCGSIMTPCPWVPHLLHAAHENKDLDLGVHITHNAEWSGYRWAPLTGRDKRGGLVDGEGWMWASVTDLHTHMDAEAAIAEMHAQVGYLVGQGVVLTHIDTHMGSVLHPMLVDAYVNLGLEFHLPVMLPRDLPDLLSSWTPPRVFPGDAEFNVLYNVVAQALAKLQDAGFPIIDHAASCGASLSGRSEAYLELINALPPGITHLLYHAAVPGTDIEAIDRSNWQFRVADYTALLDPTLHKAIDALPNVKIIGYRDLLPLVPTI